MLNQIVCVGRLVNDVERTEGNGIERATLTLAVPRSYKNEDGIYETDFVDCIVWNPIATNVAEYCHKGDLVGIKGRIQTEIIEDEEGNKKKITNVIAEKVTFLSSKSNNEE